VHHRSHHRAKIHALTKPELQRSSAWVCRSVTRRTSIRGQVPHVDEGPGTRVRLLKVVKPESNGIAGLDAVADLAQHEFVQPGSVATCAQIQKIGADKPLGKNLLTIDRNAYSDAAERVAIKITGEKRKLAGKKKSGRREQNQKGGTHLRE
jgi:hypothetical protein